TSKTPSYTKSVSWQHHPRSLEQTGTRQRVGVAGRAEKAVRS
ncbi:hypothetical protein PPECC9_27350, partial [Escherichia coli PCN009]